jgi:hypothetical protein
MSDLAQRLSPPPRSAAKVVWTVVRVGLGSVLVLAGLAAVLGTVETSYGTRVVQCGGPAFSVARRGGESPPGREADCKSSGSDQALGGGGFLVGGAALLVMPWLRRRLRSRPAPVPSPEAEPAPRPPLLPPPPIGVPPISWDPHRPVDDPGWGPALTAFIPMIGVAIASNRRRQHPNGLILVRQLFLSFVWSVVLFGFVLTLLQLSPDDASMPSGTAMVGVGVLALVVLVLRRLAMRPLDGSSEAQLAQTWRTRFFLLIGLGELPALAGFIAAFQAGSVAPYFLGAAATGVLWVRAAPTAGHIARDQEALRDQSSPLSLLAVLSTWTPRRSSK